MKLPLKIGNNKSIQVVSIELTDDKASYNYGFFKLKNNQLIPVKNRPFYSIEELLSTIQKRTPLLLHFFGKGILNRRVEIAPDYLDKLIMNASPNDFYINYTDKHNYRFVSFVRKSVIDTYIEQFSKYKDLIVNTTIGPFHVLQESLPQILETPYISFFDESDNSINFKPQTSIHSTFNFQGIAYGSGIYGALLGYIYLSNQPIPSVYKEEKVKALKSNYRDKKQFELIGISVLVIFLISLSLNYLYQGSLNEDNATLEDKIMVYSSQLSKIDQIDQEINRKTQLIQSSGILNHRFISFYLDQIGTTVIPSIRLTEIQAFPVVKKLKQKVRPDFEQGVVYISGTASSSYELDRWIIILDQLEWTNKIEILTFEKPNDAIGIFKIKVFIA